MRLAHSGDDGQPMLAAALAYAAAGWPVFPLRGKCPALPRAQGGRGYLDATTDPTVVRRMWARYPRANVGVATGRAAGIAVLDIDVPAGQDTLTRIETERGVLPGTVSATTGSGGAHLMFRWQDGLGIGSGVWGPGLDLRGQGGYIVAAPSVHPDTGNTYSWVGGPDAWRETPTPWPVDILPIPQQPAESRRRPPAPRPGACAPDDGGALTGLVKQVLGAPQGRRNELLNWASYRLGQHVAAGAIDRVTGVTALQLAAEQAGLSLREVGRTIASGLRAGETAGPR